ncbi:MAG: glutaminyl-peptide cyclotransferase [Pseudomonadota bacterium]|nr:glutaminyl-peptide cyclotransferase [Pseudomonadota bacterium]
MSLSRVPGRRAGRLAVFLAFLGLGWPAMAEPARAPDIPLYTYRVVKAYPHDPDAFTEGLFFKDGFLYESTGLKGRSSIRKVDLATGVSQMTVTLPPDVFGEGITWWGDRLIGVTWTEHIGFELDLKNFGLLHRFSYPGEGWGLARSERDIVMSDGTSELRFLDPVSLRELRRVRVTSAGRPVDQLNELEWVDGQVYANVWQTDLIARIDPASGKVVGWIDMSGLLTPADRANGHPDVLNGIAYDAKAHRLFVTGKLWPKLFEVQLVRKVGGSPR